MNIEKINSITIKRCRWLALAGMLVVTCVQATIVDALTDKSGQYIGPTVEQNIVAMDTDKNGFVDVFEVRAFLELKHGAGYKKALLDRLEANAQPNSCGTTSFVETLVSE